MSGVRVCDPELLRLGMTLPGFSERIRTVASLPSLGLLTLAGMTPPHHEVVYREVDDLPVGLDLEPFDLVAISTLTARVEDAYELADRYRALGMPVVLGGLHVSSVPEEAAGHCDALVVGEGEPVWPRLVADAERGRLQPLYRGDRPFDLAEAPMPAFHLLAPQRYERLTVQTSRGCPLRCEFCGSSVLLTPRYQKKPVDRVLAEIDRIREIWDRPFIELADDNSFVDRRYWRRLLPALAGRGLRWFAETDISVGEDPGLLELLRRAGCVEVLIGFESPVAAGLAGLELKSDWKRKRLPRYRAAVQAIQEHGVAVNGCFILGLDGQSPDIFAQVLAFAEEAGLFDVQITLQTPFPGTPLYDRLRHEGRLFAERPWRQCTLFDLTYRPSGMSAEELKAGLLWLAGQLYDEAATKRRRRAFVQTARPQPMTMEA
jgi:radical SAM superfamily enzyme YgiQ (UPF0313 family)